jgi:type IV secretion system protein VirD4
MTNEKIKKLIIPNLPYLFIFILFCNVGEAYRVSDGRNILFRCVNTFQNVGTALHNPFPSLNINDWIFGIVGAVAVYLIVQYRRKNAKKWRKDIEYGSARWGNKKDIEPFVAEKFEDNVILTATESLMLKGRPKGPKFARNKNVLIVGGSGAGKTRFWLKPNLMQMHSSYCITDPKGL